VKENENSLVFKKWQCEFLQSHVLDEQDYDRAFLAAERLKFRGGVTDGEWLEMVWLANAAFCRGGM